METNKMDVSHMSNEQIQELFEEAFRDQVASNLSIGEFECKCSRGVDGVLDMEVTVAGFAGTPIMEQFKTDNLPEARSVKISIEDRGSLEFKLVPCKTAILNTNDYVLTYIA